jgi:hypothetical protein
MTVTRDDDNNNNNYYYYYLNYLNLLLLLSKIIIIIIIRIRIKYIIIITNCNWVITRWQWLFYMYANMEKKSNQGI